MIDKEYFIARNEIAKNMIEDEKIKKKTWKLPSNCFLFKRVNSNGAVSAVMVKLEGHKLESQVIKKSILENAGLSVDDLPDYSLYKNIRKQLSDWFYSNVDLKLKYIFSEAKQKSDEFFDLNCGIAYLFRREVYKEYLESPQWQEKRMECFSVHGTKCLDCGEQAEEVHHQNYDNFCDEDVKNDLVPLCCSCHKARHENDDYYGRLAKHRIDYIYHCSKFKHETHGWLEINSFTQCEITKKPKVEFILPCRGFAQSVLVTSSSVLDFAP